MQELPAPEMVENVGPETESSVSVTELSEEPVTAMYDASGLSSSWMLEVLVETTTFASAPAGMASTPATAMNATMAERAQPGRPSGLLSPMRPW